MIPGYSLSIILQRLLLNSSRYRGEVQLIMDEGKLNKGGYSHTAVAECLNGEHAEWSGTIRKLPP